MKQCWHWTFGCMIAELPLQLPVSVPRFSNDANVCPGYIKVKIMSGVFLVSWTLFSFFWRHFATPLNGFISCLMKLMNHQDPKATISTTNIGYYGLYRLFSFKISLKDQHKTMSFKETRVNLIWLVKKKIKWLYGLISIMTIDWATWPQVQSCSSVVISPIHKAILIKYDPLSCQIKWRNVTHRMCVISLLIQHG